jgi:hypothetical protein
MIGQSFGYHSESHDAAARHRQPQYLPLFHGPWLWISEARECVAPAPRNDG